MATAIARVRPTAPATALALAVAAAAPAALAEAAVVEPGDGAPVVARPSIADRVKLDALLMLDATRAGGVFENPGRERGSAAVRRARLGAGVELGPRLEAELSVGSRTEEESVELQELSFGYRASKVNALVLGLVKQPFGLENLSSSSRLRTLERSVATNAFAPDRGAGLVWSIDGSGNYSAVGLFVDPDEREAREVAARTTWALVDDDRALVHVGASAAYRDNAGLTYRIGDEGGVDDGENVVRSAKLAPEGVATLGLELAWARDSLSAQTELFARRLSGGADGEPTFTGAYVQGGWVLGGGRRKYAKGRFGSVTGGRLARPVELVAGAGLVDLTFDGRGDRARQYVLGANVRLGEHLRLAGQLQRLVVEDADGAVDSGSGASLRVQLDL